MRRLDLPRAHSPVWSRAGSGRRQPPSTKAVTEPIRIAWPRPATSRRCCRVLVDAIHRDEPAIEVVLTFGASGQLAEQIKAGRPVRRLSRRQPDVRRGTGRRSSSSGPSRSGPMRSGRSSWRSTAKRCRRRRVEVSWTDLTKPEVKTIALANPATAPYGAAASRRSSERGSGRRSSPGSSRPRSVRQALAVRRDGQRRGRARRAGRRPEKPRSASSPSTRRSTTRSSRRWGSWRDRRSRRGRGVREFLCGPKGQAILDKLRIQARPRGSRE